MCRHLFAAWGLLYVSTYCSPPPSRSPWNVYVIERSNCGRPWYANGRLSLCVVGNAAETVSDGSQLVGFYDSPHNRQFWSSLAVVVKFGGFALKFKKITNIIRVPQWCKILIRKPLNVIITVDDLQFTPRIVDYSSN